ncbi:MAG: FtsX-like permease family protein, partial [Actinobacteria bacterium]
IVRVADLSSETMLSLTANKARSFLMILGIVVGITSVIVMVSIGNGTKASVEKSIASVGSNLLMVMPGGDRSPGQGGQSSLTMDDAEAIAKVSGVGAISPIMSGQYKVVAGSNNTNVSVTGATDQYATIRSIETSYGSWFSVGDNAGAAKVAVLGSATSETLFGTESDPVGQRIRINGEPFTVIGVAKSKGSSGFQNADEAIYIPLKTMQRFLSGGENVSTVYIQASSQEVMSSTKQSITDLLLSRHQIADSADADFQVMSQQDLANTASTVTGLLTLLLGSIAGISLVVGGIGIMNMMLTTVTERIREIGLRKAIGATRSDITSQFLAEAVALTVIGGLVGIALGWGISWAITTFSTLTTTVTSGSVLLAVGVSTAIGLVFGYYPARRAAKLDPIEA